MVEEAGLYDVVTHSPAQDLSLYNALIISSQIEIYILHHTEYRNRVYASREGISLFNCLAVASSAPTDRKETAMQDIESKILVVSNSIKDARVCKSSEPIFYRFESLLSRQ